MAGTGGVEPGHDAETGPGERTAPEESGAREESATREERTGYRSGDPTFREPEPAPARAAAPPPAPRCDLCGSSMIERHCRLVCTGCGYQRDCSDP